MALGIWEGGRGMQQSSKPSAFLPLSDPEAKILDYQTQQQKLLPQLATAYAFHFLASNLSEFLHSSCDAILNKDFSHLPEVRAVCWGAGAGKTAEIVLPNGKQPRSCSHGLLLLPPAAVQYPRTSRANYTPAYKSTYIWPLESSKNAGGNNHT